MSVVMFTECVTVCC